MADQSDEQHEARPAPPAEDRYRNQWNLRQDNKMAENFCIHLATDRERVRSCFDVIKQLRPHLTDADSFADNVERQRINGYRLEYADYEGDVVGVVAYRTLENTLYGNFVYVDDLVVTSSMRGIQVGSTLLDSARDFARDSGCSHFVLDTGLHMAEAQKFYYRNGLMARGMHFVQKLTI
jgi:GNAT superfamily N-acetyltransferase